MELVTTPLPGVFLVEPEVFGDERGFFLETFREEMFVRAGLDVHFVQDNHSRSYRGVLRGLHYQLGHSQGKLVQVVRGKVFDVAVDVRRGSPHFGRWYGALLDDESLRQMYIPPDFAHGFLVLSEAADLLYRCTDYYHPASEQGVVWNDPDLGIDWPLEGLDGPSLSDKDRTLPRLAEQTRLPLFSAV